MFWIRIFRQITLHISSTTPLQVVCTCPCLFWRSWQFLGPADHRDLDHTVGSIWRATLSKWWVLETTVTWGYLDRCYRWSWCLDDRSWWWRPPWVVWMDNPLENEWLGKRCPPGTGCLVDPWWWPANEISRIRILGRRCTGLVGLSLDPQVLCWFFWVPFSGIGLGSCKINSAQIKWSSVAAVGFSCLDRRSSNAAWKSFKASLTSPSPRSPSSSGIRKENKTILVPRLSTTTFARKAPRDSVIKEEFCSNALCSTHMKK